MDSSHPHLRRDRLLCGAGRLIVGAALAGCTAEDLPPGVTPAIWLDDDAAVGVEGVPSDGPAPHRVLFRAVNAHGASVRPEGEQTALVEGASAPIAFDGFGYGTISIEDVGTWSIEGVDGDDFEIHTVEPGWPGLPGQRAWSSPIRDRGALPEEAAVVSTGGVVSSGNGVWWAGEGAAPHRVLATDEPLLGLRSGDLDADGVKDAIAWTQHTVCLLRGRSSGGMAWGGALEAPGYSVAGADIGDLSSDNLPDIAIAWVDDGGEGILDVWEGDGLLGFEAAEPRSIPGLPTSIAIADNTGEGLRQVTVLQEEGDWSRFILGAPQQYIPIGPRAPTNTMKLPFDSVLVATGDINGDAADEITVASPRVPGAGRDLWFVDVTRDEDACLAGEASAQCSTQFLGLENEPGAYVELVDANGDYRADILLQHETASLIAVAYDPDSPSDKYVRIGVMGLPDTGPMDSGDLDRDGSVDLIVAGGPIWWRWLGRAHRDLERFWTPRPTPTVRVREQLIAPFLLVEADGNSETVEIVSTEAGDSRTILRMYQYTAGGGRAVQLPSSVDLGTSDVDDLALCGNDLYATSGGRAFRLRLDDDGLSLAAETDAGATRIACGTGPSGTQVATLGAGRVQLRNRSTLGAVGAAITATGAQDVAIGELQSGPEVRTCEEEGCSVVHWAYGARGEAVFAISSPDGIVLDDGTDEETRPGRGQLSVGDLDDDGNPDLLAADPMSGLVTLVRSNGYAPMRAELLHLSPETPPSIGDPLLLGEPGVADGDGDGILDLWLVFPDPWSDGDVTDLVYVPTVPPEDEP